MFGLLSSYWLLAECCLSVIGQAVAARYPSSVTESLAYMLCENQPQNNQLTSLVCLGETVEVTMDGGPVADPFQFSWDYYPAIIPIILLCVLLLFSPCIVGSYVIYRVYRYILVELYKEICVPVIYCAVQLVQIGLTRVRLREQGKHLKTR